MSFTVLGIVIVISHIFVRRTWADETPKLNALTFPNNLVVGSRVRVLCSTYLGDPPLDFQWMKDGRKLQSGNIEQISASVSQLSISPLQLEDMGNYSCIAKNEYGSHEVRSTLFVKAPPMWVTEPEDAKVGVGSRTYVNCLAMGSPTVRTLWKRRSPTMGNLIDVIPSSRIQILANSTLVISNAQKSEDGSYICEASNGVGATLKKSIQVTVYDRPHVQRITDYVTVERGHPVTLSCVVSGDEPLTLSWLKNRKLLHEISEIASRMKFSEDREPDSIRFGVTLTSTEMSDEGLYVCFAKNFFGSDEKEVRLLLVERPHVPESIEIVDVWSRSARISWSAPSSGNSPILSYVVEYWPGFASHKNETVPSTTTSCILRDLSPFTTYKFRVWAMNSIGASDPSHQIHFMTAKEEPSAPPMDLKIEGSGSSFVRLSWKPPPPEDWNGAIAGYYVGYKLSSSTLPFTYNTIESKDEEIHYVLRGLRKGTSYTVSVKAYNEVGSGPQSQETTFRTHNHEPPPRPTLLVKSIGSTHIQLQWFVSDETKSIVNAYTLNYRKESGKWQDLMIPDAMQNSFTLTNLDSGILYQLFLTSESTIGTSEPSDTATVQTMAEPMVHPVMTATSVETGIDEFTQTLYIVVPIAVSTVVIVTVIVIACVYVYSRRPILLSHSPIDSLPDKGFTYMATVPRNRDPQTPICIVDLTKQGSPYSTVPLTQADLEDEEPIYESVMEEIRCKIKQRAFEEQIRGANGTIV